MDVNRLSQCAVLWKRSSDREAQTSFTYQPRIHEAAMRNRMQSPFQATQDKKSLPGHPGQVERLVSPLASVRSRLSWRGAASRQGTSPQMGRCTRGWMRPRTMRLRVWSLPGCSIWRGFCGLAATWWRGMLVGSWRQSSQRTGDRLCAWSAEAGDGRDQGFAAEGVAAFAGFIADREMAGRRTTGFGS